MFIVVTKAQAKAIRRSLREQDGLPLKGITVGPVKWEPPELQVDGDGDPLPTPGWATECLPEGDESLEDPDLIAIELPTRFERFAGKKFRGVQFPALVAEKDLPKGIKNRRDLRRKMLE